MNLPIGGWRWFDFQMRPVRDDQGEVVAIVPEAVEVTESAPPRRLSDTRRRWKRSANSPVESPMTSTICSRSLDRQADLLKRRDLPAERFRRYVDAISDTAIVRPSLPTNC